MKLVLIIVVVLLAIVASLAATLLKNRAHLFEPPGFAERLSIYMSQHTAATSDNHAFPELRTPVFSVKAEDLFTAAQESAVELGWQVAEADEQGLALRAVITTPVFSFKDDLEVEVQGQGESTSTLYIKSTSRKGKGDLAANAGHVQILVERIRERLLQALPSR